MKLRQEALIILTEDMTEGLSIEQANTLPKIPQLKKAFRACMREETARGKKLFKEMKAKALDPKVSIDDTRKMVEEITKCAQIVDHLKVYLKELENRSEPLRADNYAGTLARIVSFRQGKTENLIEEDEIGGPYPIKSLLSRLPPHTVKLFSAEA